MLWNKPAASKQDIDEAKKILKDKFPKVQWEHTEKIYKLLESEDLKLFIKKQKEQNPALQWQIWKLSQKTEQELFFIFNSAVEELLNKRSNSPKPM